MLILNIKVRILERKVPIIISLRYQTNKGMNTNSNCIQINNLKNYIFDEKISKNTDEYN